MPHNHFSRLLALAFLLALSTSYTYAEPTSGFIAIAQLHPYVGGTTVYVYLTGAGPCGQLGDAYDIYTIDLSSPSGRAAYATALTAVAAGKQVRLEVIAGACGTSYPGIQSIYIGS